MPVDVTSGKMLEIFFFSRERGKYSEDDINLDDHMRNEMKDNINLVGKSRSLVLSCQDFRLPSHIVLLEAPLLFHDGRNL